MTSTPQNSASTYLYLALTLIFIGLATQLADRFDLQPLVLFGVISPMLLAMVFCGFGGGLAELKRFFAHPEGFQLNTLALLLALMLPFTLMMLSIALYSGEWVLPNFAAMPGKVLILVILMTGEEYGWRRFAFARLASNMSFMQASLIVSVVWWVWHFPGYLVGMGTPDGLSFLWFGAMLLPASILICYLYEWTRNIYWVILAHVSSNMAFNTLPFLPEVTGELLPFIIYTTLLWALAMPLVLNKQRWLTPRLTARG